ncbi:MAG: hypothetical protein NZ610_01470 [Candidatus Bipolaricaulota bacterium]|nr:hypothetical protein [Candidatus Bipolaricaulota bacterium]MCS7274061.1 hypothetical protein [Candidatus Bipolaricaulota bacterium]MDW8110658.1 hypothetical protein [Candidatus Bipolaricaulota bacterium]MDW8328484.1 hypothetical protein [Candidatus Bipolaricaulota bacterium]
MSARCPPAEGLIATAIYYLRQHDRKLGEESLQYFELPHHQGYHIQSQLVLQWPLAHTQRVRLEMEPDWRYRALRIELEAEGHVTLARYHVSEGHLRGQIEARGRKNGESKIAWRADSILDSPAALFALAGCRHLNLRERQRREIELVRLALPSLEPDCQKAQCAHLQDDICSLDIGRFPASEYLIESSKGNTLRIWIDDLGVPLRIERLEEQAPVEFTLTRYRQFRF